MSSERRQRRMRGDAFQRATEVTGADVPADERMLTVEQPARRVGLVGFSAVFWFLATASFFLDVRAGIVGGAIAAVAVDSAARE